MQPIHIITDSAALFEDDQFVEDNQITVLPLNIRFGDKPFDAEGSRASEDFLLRMQQTGSRPHVGSPGRAAFEQTFRSLIRETDRLCVVTHSRHFSQTFADAQAAASSFLGRCDIRIIDSGSLATPMAYLVEKLAEATSQGAAMEDIVHLTRTLSPRLYSIFYVDTLDYLEASGLLEDTQAILGTMLDIKPLITIEDGKLITMEKARTHAHAIDKLMEFVTEFTQIERLSVLQASSRVSDRTRMLQDRLALELSRTNHPLLVYPPLLTTLIGPDALGIGLLESA